LLLPDFGIRGLVFHVGKTNEKKNKNEAKNNEVRFSGTIRY
jgi:hypothetical protein